jgi:hypothetical protein
MEGAINSVPRSIEMAQNLISVLLALCPIIPIPPDTLQLSLPKIVFLFDNRLSGKARDR